MSDRELLELAAKAAGMNVSWDHYDPDYCARAEGMFLNGKRSPDNSKYWNPLADDGDALRLAVKLNLLIDCNYCCAMALDLPDRDWWGGGEDERAGVAHDECDPFAATRRAIVRAAAEIGRGVARPVNDDLPEDNYYKSMAEAEETGRAAAELGRSKE